MPELAQWAERAHRWRQGAAPADLPYLVRPDTVASTPREVFIYFISAAKHRNPAAAQALLRLLGEK
ncbi:hypothetical protein [Stenotrophomonas pictorum]|uniref:hypothetical protein n=1 Tax=Stenotrophomonas pictorum TaxID=86184 RepID=UPI000AC2319F